MPGRAPLRLGTRDSLLARAQSRLVARAIAAYDPGLHIELVTLDTRGDRQRHVPLSQVRDPGFFSAELDEALRAGAVDFCVHSLKDLPLEPRPGIRTAAIPVREDPRDVVVFRPDVLHLLRSGAQLRIGSSSARRAALAGDFLTDALPRLGGEPVRIASHPLRGTVEQRLARIRAARTDDRALDGVILALAGLARLWGDRDGHASIAKLLAGTRLMVLPLSACPTAPGQGALAVECRVDDARVAGLLAVLDDVATARRVRGELSLLMSRPESERDGFAATAVGHDACGTVIFTRSDRDRGRLLWSIPARPGTTRPWDGADWIHASGYRELRRPDFSTARLVFLAHWRALPPGISLPPEARVWVSGTESWRRLARRGVWVEGCADNLGFEALLPTLRSAVLRLPPLGEWTVATRDDATASWDDLGVGRIVATYAIDPPQDQAMLHAIRERVAGASHFFWGSAAQYRALRPWVPRAAHNACGPGKTFRALRAAGVPNLQAFPSRREWQAWLA